MHVLQYFIRKPRRKVAQDCGVDAVFDIIKKRRSNNVNSVLYVHSKKES